MTFKEYAHLIADKVDIAEREGNRLEAIRLLYLLADICREAVDKLNKND